MGKSWESLGRLFLFWSRSSNSLQHLSTAPSPKLLNPRPHRAKAQSPYPTPNCHPKWIPNPTRGLFTKDKFESPNHTFPRSAHVCIALTRVNDRPAPLAEIFPASRAPPAEFPTRRCPKRALGYQALNVTRRDTIQGNHLQVGAHSPQNRSGNSFFKGYWVHQVMRRHGISMRFRKLCQQDGASEDARAWKEFSC